MARVDEMRPDSESQTHSIMTIEGAGGYQLHARYWAAENAQALLVLVHGVVSHSLWLEAITQPLAQTQIACLAVDRRGAGLNQQGRGDADSPATLYDDLDAVMRWAGQQQLAVHLCGFCWGANYVVNYLHEKPRTVASLVLIAPSLFPSEWLQERPFVTGDSAVASEEPVMPIEQFTDGPMFESFIRPDPLRVRRVSTRLNSCMQAMSTGLWMKFLRLDLPCLMLLGDKDTVVDNSATAQVFERYKNRRKALHILPAWHGIQFDAAETTHKLVSEWILHLPLSASTQQPE